MGKKDEIIKGLEDKVNDLTSEKSILETSVKDLAVRNEGLSTSNKSLMGDYHKMKEMFEAQIKQYQDKVTELMEYKSLMITTVDIAGVADITKTLNDAVKLLEDSLEALGLKDKYTILAVPHTMSIGIVR